MSTKRVGVVVSMLQNKGPINVIRGQLKAKSKSHEYVVFCLSDFIDKKIELELTSLGVSVVVVDTKISFRSISKLKRMLIEHSVDVIHSHGLSADVICSLLPRFIKKVSTVHNRLLEDYIPQFGYFKAMIFFLVHWGAYQRIDKIVACSNAVGCSLDKLFLQHAVIQNGVDTSFYHALDLDGKVSLRASKKINCNGLVYLYCGSYCRRKNVLNLLKMLKLRQDDILLLVGDGPLLIECKKMVGNDSRYIFIGQVDSCRDYYQLADIFVSASLSEGLPLALLEAYSCGLSLLVSDIPSHREIYKMSNENRVRLFELDGGSIELSCFPGLMSDDHKLDGLTFSADAMARKYEDLVYGDLSD